MKRTKSLLKTAYDTNPQAEQPEPPEAVNKPDKEEDNMKIHHRREGAIFAYDIMAKIALIQKSDSLKRIHDDKTWKNLGYKSFEEYGKMELHMGRDKLHYTLNIIKTLKPEIFANLTLLNFTTKHLRILAENVEAVDVASNTLTINGKQIACLPENIDFLKAEIKAIEAEKELADKVAAEEKVLRCKIQEKFEQIQKKTDDTIEQYRLKLDQISVQFQTLFKPIEELAGEAKNDRSKHELFYSYLTGINTLIMEKIETYMGETKRSS